MAMVSMPHAFSHSAIRYSSPVKAANSRTGLVVPVSGHRHIMGCSTHVNAGGIRVDPRQCSGRSLVPASGFGPRFRHPCSSLRLLGAKIHWAVGKRPKDTLSNGILPPVTTAIVARSPRPSSESGNPCTNEAHGLLLPSTRQHTSEGCTIPCHLRYLAACRRLPKLRMTVLASVFPGAFKQMVLNEVLLGGPCAARLQARNKCAARVQRVADAVAYDAEAEHGQEDRHAWEEAHPRRPFQVVAARVEHRAPGRRWGLGPQTQEGE